MNIGVSDSGSPQLSDTQLVTIDLPRLNQSPTVTNPGDQVSSEGAEITLTIKATDPDALGDTLRFSAAELPAGLSIDSVTGVIAGEIDYEAAGGSPYTVTVTATDNGSPQKSDTESFEWTVDETNRPPTATASVVIALIGEPTLVLLNAEDPDGDELEYTISVNPVAGILEGEAPELFYTSPGGVPGDAFTFVVTDGEFEAEAEVTLEIRTSNMPPTADADSYDVVADELLRVNAPGVLGNDSDLDADILTAVLISQPDHGILVLNNDGSFTYLPDEGFAGGDKFIYAATDALGEQSTATVLLNIEAPVAVAVLPTEEGPRAGVVVASTALWQPPPTGDEAILTEVPRAVVMALNRGMSSLPELRFPLLLLAIALLLGLTFGRISVLPFGATRRHEEGWVQAYDEVHEVGTVIPDGGASEVFVHGRSLEKMESLTPGQRVRFVAAETRGRRLALKVWPATSPWWLRLVS
jgi:cold shock CspA family protein